MKVKVLSVRNPISYLICAGIKDVENRSWTTSYRGRLYIHSSGNDEAHCFNPEWYDLLPVHKIVAESKEVEGRLVVPENDILGTDGEQFLLKDESHIAEARLVSMEEDAIMEDRIPFKAKAIIGHVDLVDIITDSPSKWAFEGNYHWIIKNPVLFEKPIENILGKLRLFELDI